MRRFLPMTTLQITRYLPVIARTTSTLAVGDVVSEGLGTSHVTARVVTAVKTWTHNGYRNAVVTFADGETKTYYDGYRWPLVVAVAQ